MTFALIAIAALLCVALGVQVYYARAYSAHATLAVKIVWGFNMALLVVLIVAVIGYAFVGVG